MRQQPVRKAAFVFVIAAFSMVSAHAATTIPAQTISTNTTWTKLASPYVVTGDVTVSSGVTLTIEPGATVQFNQYAGLIVNGRLTAAGTSLNPILFTRSSVAVPSWDGIHVIGTSIAPNTESVFDYVTIEYGGDSYASIYLEYAKVTVAHSTIRNGVDDAINGWTGSGADISATSFIGNTGAAAYFSDSSMNMVFSSVTASGNGDNTIGLGAGTLSGAHVWENAGVPYTIKGDITVPAGSVLTIQPGLELKFAQYAGIVVQGQILAVGTAIAPINFHGVVAGQGYWDGIRLMGTSGARVTGSSFDHVSITDGGDYTAGIYGEYADISVANSTISNNAGSAIYGWTGTSIQVSNSTLSNNQEYAIEQLDPSYDAQLSGITATGNTKNAIGVHGGTISTNHQWEVAGLTYEILGDVTVADGSTLTIQPGLQLNFAQYASIVVEGRILAVGTAAAPINFHGLTAGQRSWDGIRLMGASGSRITGSSFDHVSITDGGDYYGGIYAEYADVTVANSTISSNGGSAIYGWMGVAIQVTNCTLSNNQNFAIEQVDPTIDAHFTAITATGNGKNAIFLHGGTLTGNHVWELAGLTYELPGDITVASGATLTIAPGLQVFFAQYASIAVDGTLTAVGTSSLPISFARTAASTGAWDGIRFTGTSSAPLTGSVLDWVSLSGGGGYYANVYLEYATVDISHSTITGSAADGIYCWTGGVPRLSDVTVSGSADYAIQLSTASVDPQLTRVAVSGNLHDAIAYGGGTTSGAVRWESLGFPYILLGDVTVGPDSTLTIEPGLHVFGEQYASVDVQGRLIASGTELAPIIFDGTAGTPGSWDGIRVVGPATGEPLSGTILEHVSILHGGTYYANLYIEHAIVTVRKSIISGSSTDGVYIWSGGGGTLIETTQIVGNTQDGVVNHSSDVSDLVMATNNWWGSVTGPTAAGAVCNPSGTGSTVVGPVAFKPFLTDPNAVPGIISPSDVRILEIQPHRWFAPANGITRVYVDATLRDGNGNPLAGRVVSLDVTSGPGTTVDGGTTDVNGKTYAYVYSAAPGDSVIRAGLAVESACESATSPTATITFTAVDQNPLTADEEAPYMNDGIEINPEPITRGVPTKVRVHLTNTNPFPLTVDGSFGFAQLGIGLTFGPIGEVFGQVIPANSVGVIETDWTPQVEGHYCMQFQYTYTSSAKMAMPLGSGSGRTQRNLNVYGGSLGGPGEKDSLNRADKAFKGVSKLTPKPLKIQKALIERWWDWVKKTATEISENLGGDPPRLDYDRIAVLEPKPVFPPVVASADVSAARAAAINDYSDAMLDVLTAGQAAVITMDRYGGAAQANDLLWSSQQAAALIHFKEILGNNLKAAADKLDAYLAVLKSEGVTTNEFTAQDFIAYQQQIAGGFSAQEVSDAKALGWTDAEIEAWRQELLASDPVKAAGDAMVLLAEESTAMRQLGTALTTPQNFSYQVSGGSGKTANAFVQSDRLARIFTSHSTFEVGNPLATNAGITLRVRRVSLPADWGVIVSPSAFTLAPAAQQTVDIAITPGSAAVQGTQPRVAVEAYAGTQLLGGVAFDVMVPNGVPFRKGDATGDDALSSADVIYIVNYLFGGGASPIGPADCNADGLVTSQDLFYMINYMFAGGPAPLP